MAGRRIGFRRDDDEIGFRAVGAPRLGAVDAVAARLTDRARADAGGVGAGLRLGDGNRGLQRAAGEARQPALMLLRRAARQHGRKRRPLHQQQVGGVVADAPQLLDGKAAGEHAVRAAVALREGQGEEAEVAQRREHVMRIGGLAVYLRRARRHLLAGKRAHRVAQQPLFVAEPEILREHYASASLLRPAGRPLLRRSAWRIIWRIAALSPADNGVRPSAPPPPVSPRPEPRLRDSRPSGTRI